MNAPNELGLDPETNGAMRTEYLHVFTDENGDTQLAEVSVELFPQNFAPPAAPLNVAGLMQATDCYLVGAEPDWHGGTPHPTPHRQIFCILRGRCAVTVSTGETREGGPGTLMLLEDTTGRGHSTRVVGNEPLLLLGIRAADQSPG